MKTILVIISAAIHNRNYSGLCLIIGCAFFLSACSFGNQTRYFKPDHSTSADIKLGLSPVLSSVEQGQAIEDFYPENSPEEKKKKNIIKLGLSRDAAKALGCDMGDRFDRGAALAYNFDNRQSRLAFHLSVDGPSLSNPSNLELNSAMIRFTHKFQKPPKSQDKKCLFPSNFQGLIGSVYNEFFIRNNYTILDELKEKGFDLK